MPNFAVIESNVVTNTIVADNLEIAKIVTGRECIDISDTLFGIGDFWDGTKLVKVEDVTSQIIESVE